MTRGLDRRVAALSVHVAAVKRAGLASVRGEVLRFRRLEKLAALSEAERDVVVRALQTDTAGLRHLVLSSDGEILQSLAAKSVVSQNQDLVALSPWVAALAEEVWPV